MLDKARSQSSAAEAAWEDEVAFLERHGAGRDQAQRLGQPRRSLAPRAAPAAGLHMAAIFDRGKWQTQQEQLDEEGRCPLVRKWGGARRHNPVHQRLTAPDRTHRRCPPTPFLSEAVGQSLAAAAARQARRPARARAGGGSGGVRRERSRTCIRAWCRKSRGRRRRNMLELGVQRLVWAGVVFVMED